MTHHTTTDSDASAKIVKRKASKRDAAERAAKSISKQAKQVASDVQDDSPASGDEAPKRRPKPKPRNPAEAPVNRALPGSAEQRGRKSAGNMQAEAPNLFPRLMSAAGAGVGGMRGPKATSHFLQLKSMATSTLPDGWRNESFDPQVVSLSIEGLTLSPAITHCVILLICNRY